MKPAVITPPAVPVLNRVQKIARTKAKTQVLTESQLEVKTQMVESYLSSMSAL